MIARPRLAHQAGRLSRILRGWADLDFFFRHFMSGLIVMAIADRWEPRPLALEVTLFRAQLRSPTLPHDLGWAAATPRLTIVDIDGDHHSMLRGEHGGEVAAQIRGLIEAYC